MSHSPYSYSKSFNTNYTFVSSGKRDIEKVVTFTPTAIENLYNLGFGDLLPDGFIDDKFNSNNGDIIKVLATVVSIIKDFTHNSPNIRIIFTGSTAERSRLYRRIINTHYTSFSKEFIISSLIEVKTGYTEVIFNQDAKVEYLAFIVKRIH